MVGGSRSHRVPARARGLRPPGRSVPAALLTSAVAVVALALAVGWVAHDNEFSPAREGRELTTVDVTGCLVTDVRGLSDEVAAAVWSGLQGASAQTRVRANYLPTLSGRSVDDAVPYVNTLITSRCTVIAAVGSAQVGAVLRVAPSHPGIRFVVVGEAGSAKNVIGLPKDPARVADAVRRVLAEATERIS